MALKLNLKPGEKIVINGAVIVNGDRKASLGVKNFANILRESDVMQEEEANTPTKRAYFAAQLMLLDPEHRADYEAPFRRYMKDLIGAFTNRDMLDLLQLALEHHDAGDYYKILAVLRKVISYEEVLLQSIEARPLPPLVDVIEEEDAARHKRGRRSSPEGVEERDDHQ
ncbi:flagellar biosynthesis repressor FlbT [Caenispirillum salinarum]|uniref:flagellar biosynthesis repressor FlbT n=1 Tax=Caenispirillum salinarum TaxID=859058 RepID=UPI00384D4F48